MRLKYLALASFAALSACSSPPPPEPPKPVVKPPVVVVEPPRPTLVQPTGEWTDWPLAQGDWVYRQDDRGSIALFGAPGKDADVTLRCDKGRQRIYLSRKGAGNASTMTVRTSATLKQLGAGPTGGTPPYVAAELMPRDAILDAMIYSRGRVAIIADGTLSIAIPNWTEIARVVEDCRG